MTETHALCVRGEPVPCGHLECCQSCGGDDMLGVGRRWCDCAVPPTVRPGELEVLAERAFQRQRRRRAA